MKVTVIQNSTKAVFVNGISLMNLSFTMPDDVQSLRWEDEKAGTIFKYSGENQVIAALPDWATQAINVFQMSLPPEPVEPTLAEQASAMLYTTDWTSIPDITDPTKSTPVLTNQAEFLAYRNQLRAIVLGLNGALPALPPKPTAQWSA